jgi:hypothetical protein
MANPNIVPRWKPGQSGNPAGRPKGIPDKRTLAQIVREEMANIDWDKVPIKDPGKMHERYGNSGWKAMVSVAASKAMSGDIRAMEFLRKSGFGDMLDVTSMGEKIDPVVIYRPAKLEEDADTQTESR